MRKKEEVIEKERWTSAAWDMLYLVQCGINSIIPDPERVSKMDLEKVYARSRSQSLEALTYMALESLLEPNPQTQISDAKQVLPKWKEAKNKAVAKNLMMDIAREELFAFLKAREIWHVALKGVVLCHMYPQYGMRQMADNDILFDPSFRQEVHDWFVEQGYKVESFQQTNHDEYLKKPVYNFEMHTALFQESEQPRLTQYYLTIRDRLIQKDGQSFEYCMTDEDFYLYLVAHEYKHFLNGGTGLRSLVDVYICNKVKDKMDQSYLKQQLDQMGILEFEHEIKALAQKVLNSEAATEKFFNALSVKEQVMLEELVSSSTYGMKQRFWKNQLLKIQPNTNRMSITIKLRYSIHRLFPDRTYMEEWCQQYAPYFLQHKWLMPLASIWRIIKRGVKKRAQIKEELDTIRKA